MVRFTHPTDCGLNDVKSKNSQPLRVRWHTPRKSDKPDLLIALSGIVKEISTIQFAFRQRLFEPLDAFASNLGVIDIDKGDYQAALTKFSGVKCDYNVALAQM